MRTCCATDDHKSHHPSCDNYRKPVVRVLSFGAGTQSSAVLGLIEEGKLPPVDFAVFADTQCEPDEVYRWLEKVQGWVKKTRIIVATVGNLMEDALAAAAGEGTRSASLPLFTDEIATERTAPAGYFDKETKFFEVEEGGIIKRQCTMEYKISVVQKAIRSELGYAPRQRVKHTVEMLIAMSLEETIRMKNSREKWITNKYPLIFDVPMHRHQSIEYVRSLGLGTPPRSSCMMCPFHSNAEWRHLRDTEPHNFQKAIDFDNAIRKLPRMESETFLHPDRIPLSEVNLEEDNSQLDLFQNDCSGMCGA